VTGAQLAARDALTASAKEDAAALNRRLPPRPSTSAQAASTSAQAASTSAQGPRRRPQQTSRPPPHPHYPVGAGDVVPAEMVRQILEDISDSSRSVASSQQQLAETMARQSQETMQNLRNIAEYLKAMTDASLRREAREEEARQAEANRSNTFVRRMQRFHELIRRTSPSTFDEIETLLEDDAVRMLSIFIQNFNGLSKRKQ
jgi:hypothetical protein